MTILCFAPYETSSSCHLILQCMLSPADGINFLPKLGCKSFPGNKYGIFSPWNIKAIFFLPYSFQLCLFFFLVTFEYPGVFDKLPTSFSMFLYVFFIIYFLRILFLLISWIMYMKRPGYSAWTFNVLNPTSVWGGGLVCPLL